MQPHDRFVSINGIRLHYLEWGESSAPPVVLLHGGSAHARWWDQFAAACADTHRVFALDMRGHGDSEHPEPAAYRIADYAQDLAAFVDTEVGAAFDLIGHSLGAMVAVAYAARTPLRLNSLVVVDSALKITPAGVRYMNRLRNFPSSVYPNRAEAIRRFRLLPVRTEAEETLLAHVAAHGIRQLPDGRWTFKFNRDALAIDGPQDLTPLLEQLTCPILFVRGAHSTLMSQASLAALLASSPHAHGTEIPNAHHHVMLDNPTAFESVTRDFLKREGVRV